MIRYMLKEVGEQAKMVEEDLNLDGMRKIVGGYLDVVRLPHNIDMWVNDEGLLEELPINLVLVDGVNTQPIVGNVFFAGHDSEGDTVSLDANQTIWLIENLNPRGRHISNIEILVYGLDIQE